ncbi:hypothetical protein MTO96_022725 [Rhipicephalus appendiculatus]
MPPEGSAVDFTRSVSSLSWFNGAFLWFTDLTSTSGYTTRTKQGEVGSHLGGNLEKASATMRVCWLLFFSLTAVMWYLCPRLPLLPGVAHGLGSLLVSGHGKAVLITGCDTGFGHLLANYLARDGFLVFAGCLDANGEGAMTLKRQSNIKVLQMDVTKDVEIEGAHRVIKEELGTRKLWAVVCNAAIMNSGLVEWLTMASITRIFDVNVFGVVRVVKRFLPMLKETQGRAVIVTSNLSHFTLPFTTPYAMTKHAVQSLVDGLRRECHGKGVDIVAVEPLTYRSKVTDAVGCLSAVEKEFKSQPAEVTAGFNAQELPRLDALDEGPL